MLTLLCESFDMKQHTSRISADQPSSGGAHWCLTTPESSECHLMDAASPASVTRAEPTAAV